MILGDKVLVVSGAGPGLGRAIARRALRDGARVLLAARNAERIAALAQELDSGERVAHRACDISDAAQCEALVADAESRFGGLDALVQVAALDAVFGGLETVSAEDWRAVMEVNVIGAVQLCRAAAPALARRGGGALVLIGSQSYAQPPPTPQMAYAASKAALLSASLQMAAELGPQKIRVNTVVPTWMWGPPVQGYIRWQAQERGISEQQLKAEIAARFPIGEIPADGDVAEVAVLFCSDRMRMVTGQFLRVDGGERMNL